MDKFRTLLEACNKANIPVLALSASNDIATNTFKEKHKLTLNFYTLDGTVCKTAMRSNPGIMLLSGGNVAGKWSYADYPNLSSLNLDLSKNSMPMFSSPTEAVVPETQAPSE
jgi:hypothetical protein